jgi:energy-converting hydrogenase Eha subunit A
MTDTLAKSLRDELEQLRRREPARSTVFYMSMIFGLTILALMTVVLVLFLRPGEDNTVVVVAILGFLAPILAAIVGMMVKDVHTMVNSRMDALLSATERAATAEGRAAGRAEGEEDTQ